MFLQHTSYTVLLSCCADIQIFIYCLVNECWLNVCRILKLLFPENVVLYQMILLALVVNENINKACPPPLLNICLCLSYTTWLKPVCLCKDLSHMRINEVQHWCWAERPGSQSVVQLISKVLDGVEVRALQACQVLPQQTGKTIC